MFIGKTVRTVYHEMQKHYLTFRFLVWLKEKGITRRVNHLISHDGDKSDRVNPSKGMIEAQKYFNDPTVKERLNVVVKLLADNKSRAVMGRVLRYRMYKEPIRRDLYSEHDQYFVDDLVKLQDGEVFVDGGAYTGDTVQQLFDTAKRENITIKKVIAFEPDEDNYKLLNKFYGNRENVKIYKKGLSDKEETLFFKSAGVNARVVDNEGEADSKIDVINIDVVSECHGATYIKMDIEGAEWDALHGAKKTIKQNKPKLAICLYHSDEDMVRLIEYVHELVPEYKLYVRHHSRSDVETVLYAII